MTTESAVEQAFEEHGYTTDGAVEAMMAKWGVKEEEDGESPPNSPDRPDEGNQDGSSDKDEGSQDDENGDANEDGEADQEEVETTDDSDEDSDDSEEGEESGTPSAADDAKVTVQVNGESKEFTVGELKRLAGQEAALTQKSQEVAAYRKQFEQGLRAQRTALETMLERAQKRFEPYKDFDFALAAQQYDPETYKALKEDAQSAHSDLQFYQQELGQVLQAQDKYRQETLLARAQEAVKELSDPEKGIPGFNRELFGSMREYAINQGMDQEVVDTIVDPAAWRVLHKAMEFDKLQQAKKSAKPTVKTARRTIKTTKSQSGASASRERRQSDDMSRIANATGLDSVEAAAEALMRRWQS